MCENRTKIARSAIIMFITSNIMTLIMLIMLQTTNKILTTTITWLMTTANNCRGAGDAFQDPRHARSFNPVLNRFPAERRYIVVWEEIELRGEEAEKRKRWNFITLKSKLRKMKKDWNVRRELLHDCMVARSLPHYLAQLLTIACLVGSVVVFRELWATNNIAIVACYTDVFTGSNSDNKVHPCFERFVVTALTCSRLQFAIISSSVAALLLNASLTVLRLPSDLSLFCLIYVFIVLTIIRSIGAPFNRPQSTALTSHR